MSNTHVYRLKPGVDLKKEIESFVKEKNILAGWIACGVGSLTEYHIRFANQREGSKGKGHFEIVSLMGTVSVNGCHIHISISDENGRTIGGHLLEGSIVFTTAEIVIEEAEGFVFSREEDEETGWRELQINPLKQ